MRAPPFDNILHQTRVTNQHDLKKGAKMMNELIPIRYDEERPTVSARDLHEFLEVETDFRHWFPRMREYGFTEGVDFNPVKIDRVQNEGGRRKSTHD